MRSHCPLRAPAFVLGALLLVGVPSSAQIPEEGPAVAPSTVAFELISVKENPRPLSETGPPTLAMHPSGHFRSIANTLSRLIRVAYNVDFSFQIVSGPDWLNTSRFDILAVAPDDFEMTHTRAMMRQMLESRFGLATHRTTRRMQVYALEWATAARKPGRGLRPSPKTCNPRERVYPPWQLAPDIPDIRSTECRSSLGWAPSFFWTRRHPLIALASTLREELGRPVVDRTGTTGIYDIDLVYTSTLDGPFHRGPEGTPDRGGDQSIVDAIREQLGLKLTPIEADVEVLVIDRVSAPVVD